MATKDVLANLLAEGAAPPPAIKRGQGVRLSTEREREDSAPPAGGVAVSHNRTIAQTRPGEVIRKNRGYALRLDLIKACKRLGVETGRPLYEIMEEALAEYLERHRERPTP